MPEKYNWNQAWEKPERPAPVIPLPTGNGTTPYANKALTEELHLLATTSEGARNDQLNRSAFNLAQLVAAGHLNQTTTEAQLRATAVAIGLTPGEVEATIRSAFKAATPRVIPELEIKPNVEEVQWDPETGEQINPSPSGEPSAVDRRQQQIEANYITHDGLSNIIPPQPLITGWLYQNSLAWLAGKPGDGKSFIALDMAYSVATGQPWQGHQTVQGTVLYIAAEGASGLSIRAKAWTMANGNPQQPPIYYLPIALRLTGPGEIDTLALMQALTALNPTLIIIDTQARVTTGAEENSAKDMGWFIDALELLRRAHPATYLTVHHTPRNGDNLRGSIALEGAADTVLLATKDGEVVTLKCQKQKNAAPADDFSMYLQPIGDSIVMSREGVELASKMTKIMEQLLRALVEGLRRESGSTELREYCGLGSGGNFSRPISDLVNLGFVTLRKEGNRRFYDATSKGKLHLLQVTPQAPGVTGIAGSKAPPPL